MLHRQLGLSKGPEYQTALLTGSAGWYSTPEVADRGRWESSLMAVASGDLRELPD